MPSTADVSPGTSDVEGAVAPVVEEAGLVLEAVERPGGDPPVLRVVVDRPDGTEGLDLDLIAELSQRLDETLEAGVLADAGAYELEVTSPGADRPLTLPRHWVRNVGRMVQIGLADGESLGGLLLAADGTGIELEPVRPAPKKGMRPKVGAPRRLDHAQIRTGRVDVEATAARVESQLKKDEEA